MGKGDKKTKKGKIFRGTFGKIRPRGKKNSSTAKSNNASAASDA